MRRTLKRSPDEDVTLNVPLPQELHDKLEEIARRERRSKRRQAAHILTREVTELMKTAAGQLVKAG